MGTIGTGQAPNTSQAGPLNSDDLESFLRVAEWGSFSRAALETGVDQSTLSRHIARLEEAAGGRLFHRSGRGVVLTEAGQSLLPHAQRVLAALRETRASLGAHATEGPAQVVIAAQSTIARLGFPPIAAAIAQRFPGTRVRFVEGLGVHMVGWLQSGEIDLAVLYKPQNPRDLKLDVLLREPVCLISRAGDPPVGDSIPMAQAARLPLILPSTPHGSRLLAEWAAGQAGVPLNIAIECDTSTSVMRRLVLQGCGATLLPAAAAMREIGQGLLKATPVTGVDLTREIAVVSAHNRPAIRGHWEIAQIIRREILKIAAEGHWPGAIVAEG